LDHILFSEFASCLLKLTETQAFACKALSSNEKKQGLAVALGYCPFQLYLLIEQYHICLRSDPYPWRSKRITSRLLPSRWAALLLREPVPHYGFQSCSQYLLYGERGS